MSFLALLIHLCILGSNGVAARTSFKTIHGDIYDCVDFYKQPAFDHPMLKNHNFHPRMKPSFLTKITGKSITKVEGCQIGTVPIRRITSNNSKIESFMTVNEASGTYVAGVRTKAGQNRFGGGGMEVTIYNPSFVRPLTYSEARIKVSNGPDAIQVGWRVDPSLRGDNLTRQYIYTETSESRCFDAQCGFVITDTEFAIDQVLQPVSKVGGLTYVDIFNITRDQQSGNWWFVYTRKQVAIGFWPKDIFTGLRDFASNVEWAGEVYSPSGVNEPVMGSGYRPNIDNPNYVAFFDYLTVITENYTLIPAGELEEFATDRTLYDVKDKGYGGQLYGRYAFFGGARY